jgi:hypothetical protein
MSKRSPPGNSVVSRLADRDSAGLVRRQMPGGGEVFTGPTAGRALRALGARAFTMDSKIFVAEDFDPSKPEDQALYAHERHHQLESGGDGAAQTYHDAEERASRAIERMVLHRAASGEDFETILREVESRAFRTESDVARHVARSEALESGSPSHAMDPAEAALAALLSTGRSEESIIAELAEEIVNSLVAQGALASLQGRSVGFI